MVKSRECFNLPDEDLFLVGTQLRKTFHSNPEACHPMFVQLNWKKRIRADHIDLLERS
jgi:hypothetical protein